MRFGFSRFNFIISGQVRLLLIGIVALIVIAGCGSSDPKQLIAKAQQYRQSGNMASAIIELKNAVQKDPNNNEAHVLLAMTYLDDGDPAAAEAELRKAKRAEYNPEQVATLLGTTYMREGFYEKALSELDGIPDSAQISTLRGSASLLFERYLAADADFTRALKLEPNYVPALLGQARLAAAQQNLDVAVKLLDQAIALAPRDFDVQMLRGDLEAQRKNGDAAKAAYDRALEIRPNNLTALIHRAALLTKLQKYDAAQADIDAARRLKPSEPLVDYAQAVLLFQKNEMRPALDAVRKVLKVAPGNMASVMLAALLENQVGSPEKAARYAAQFLDRYPDNLFARKVLISSLLKADMADAAIKALPATLKLAPEDPRVLTLAGETYMQAHEYTQATEYLQRAANLTPNDPARLAEIGMARIAARDEEGAIADLEKAVDLERGLSAADTLLVLAFQRRQEFDKALALASKLAQRDPQNPVAFYLLGGAYMGKGDKANARKSFEQSLALRKDYMPSAMLLARLDLEDNQPDRARERFKGALKADPKDLDAMIGLASIDRSTGNMTGYRDWLEKAHKMDPSAEAPALLLGRYYLTKRDFAKAEAVAKDVLATQPRHPDMINLLAEAQAARGDKLTAMRTYARLAETVPLSADAHYKLAMARLATGDYERAGESLRAALKLKPDHVDALAAMALVEYQAGNYSEVIRLARQVQRLAPQLPIGLILEGDGLMAVHDYGAAGNAYERAFAMRKTDALAVKLHAAKSQVGNKDEATARLVAWQRYHPKETGSRLYLADVYVRAGQKTQAIELYEQVLDLDPQNLLALNNVATLYQQNKDPRALQYFEQSYKLNPESATLADNLGWALVQQGELQKGVELLYKATAKAPDNPDMRYHLVAAIAKSGEKERAREELQKLLSKYIDFQHRQDAQTLLEQLGGPPG